MLVTGAVAGPAAAREHDRARPVARDAATAGSAIAVEPGPLAGGGYVSVGSPDTRLVTFVQRRIERSGIRVGVDGVFGSETETAVRRFQATGRLLVDGIIGRQTMAALKGPGKGPPSAGDGLPGGVKAPSGTGDAAPGAVEETPGTVKGPESRLESQTPRTGAPLSPATGRVRFVKEAKANFDSYTSNPSAQRKAWMRGHYFRAKTYSPYFDERVSWFPNAWAYKDLYAIYVDDDLARERPEWILRDAQGRKLYIPWGCSRGTCPQYAGDVGNPAFRAHWLAEARTAMAKGYKGLFVDDVNMEFRVGNGNGDEVAPIDPRTGRTMSHGTWRRYIAEFAEAIRRTFPNLEVAHNPIWWSGHTEPQVRRALLAADYINLEHGVSDEGIQRGGGQFGYESFLAHVDWLHAHGKAVVLDSYAKDRPSTEYNLATYFLINGTRDGFRTDYRTVPDDWWTGYDLDLGAARGGRYEWRGLLRRDFQRGYVLVNQPRSPAVTIALPAGSRGADGGPRPSVQLGAASGAVVLGSAPADRRASIALRPIPHPAGARTSAQGTRRRERLRGAVLLKGRLRGAQSRRARVRLIVRRRVRGRWVQMRRIRAAVHSRGRFVRLVRGLKRGRYRVSARYGRSARAGAPVITRGFRIRR